MYCCRVLRLSEHGSYNRIEAARTARRFPAVLEMLGDGRLNLATLRLLSPQLTEHNHQELLAEASDLSKREVEELVAQRFPRPDVVTTIRKVPTRHSTAGISGIPPIAGAAASAAAEGSSIPSTAAAVLLAPATSSAASANQPARQARVAPLSEGRFQIKFTASAETVARLRQAQDLLRHAVPSGDAAEIIDRALIVLVKELTRKKIAGSDRPRPPRGTAAGSRHVPAPVKRTVWMRDGGRCGFVVKGGRRCDERSSLEFHHVRPYAAGGEATIDNIELRCRAHNAHEAALFYEPIRRAMSESHATRPGTS
jgi:hypothetical protein